MTFVNKNNGIITYYFPSHYVSAALIFYVGDLIKFLCYLLAFLTCFIIYKLLITGIITLDLFLFF